MVKFCLQCKNAFWGGQYCPKCEGEIELLDAALPENKKYLPELNIDVRPKYYARSSMLLSCFGFVMALPLGAFIFLAFNSMAKDTYQIYLLFCFFLVEDQYINNYPFEAML